MATYINSIIQAILSGELEKALTFLRSKPELMNERDDQGVTPLIAACRHGDRKLIDLLIGAGALLNLPSTDALAETPLHAAVRAHLPAELCLRLVTIGAELNARDHERATPLHVAVAEGQSELVAMFVEEGADPALKDSHKRNCVDLAREKSRDDLVQILRRALRPE